MKPLGKSELLMTVLLLSGCFQEEAPRHVAPAAVAASPVAVQAGTKFADETSDEGAANVPELVAMLEGSVDPEVRREAIYAIADAGEADDAAIIAQSLTDPDSGVRKAAIEALTGIGGENSANWLSLGLGDPDPRIRRTAVEALGVVGGDSAQFLLQQALGDVDQDVREAAQQILDEPRSKHDVRSSYP
jgi:HEAT repeat protein